MFKSSLGWVLAGWLLIWVLMTIHLNLNIWATVYVRKYIRSRMLIWVSTWACMVTCNIIHCVFFYLRFFWLWVMEKLAIHNQKNLAIETQPTVGGIKWWHFRSIPFHKNRTHSTLLWHSKFCWDTVLLSFFNTNRVLWSLLDWEQILLSTIDRSSTANQLLSPHKRPDRLK